jgi:hypothetical protein
MMMPEQKRKMDAILSDQEFRRAMEEIFFTDDAYGTFEIPANETLEEKRRRLGWDENDLPFDHKPLDDRG